MFNHDEENVDIPCVLVNTSLYERYQLFSFTEGVDATLKYTGDYVLKVYEQDNPTNLDPANTIGLVHIEETLVFKEPFEYKVNNPDIIRDINELS